MNPTDLPAETLFEGALKCRTPGERVAYLDEFCAGKPELRRKMETLLEAHDRSGEFLEATLTATDQSTDVTAEEQPGTMIGRYKLLQKIGEGGMGVVYMAEQTEPMVRKVAFKIIKLGMDTRQVVARFEAERQALALMDHPNIAKVLDAGATETGRPYFVMELVHGVPITEYCDKNKLSTRERLELFIVVCQAIQHAHQKGIIHRDIKPTNVMVTLHDGVPVPKVIDFGVAKATNQRLTEKTLFTNYAQMIGTPAYMSPEQAEMSGLDVDTRSDIYSLGVLLYELLTGSTPFDAKELLSKGYAEMQRIIAEQEPVKPSTRMSTLQKEERTVLAKNRSMEESALRKLLQGDLDWIVIKCLEKDRTRRYETSNGLAGDLRRHLNNELISARPPTTSYLLKKLIKRNKVAFVASAAIAASLVVGITISIWQAIVARQAEHRAKDAERRALTTVEELRRTAPAFAEQARGLVAQSKFDEAIEKLDYAIELRPDVGTYLLLKANFLQCQLRLSEAAKFYRAALKVRADDDLAKANLKLTEDLLLVQARNQGRLSTEDLARLQTAMQAEQRSAAELLPISEKLGQEKELLLAYWLERLRALPITKQKPLKERLSLNDAGKLELDLSATGIHDLSPLTGMPLERLNLTGCRNLSDLSPLRNLPMKTLVLENTGVTELTPLAEVSVLKQLVVNSNQISSLDPLRGLRLESLSASFCPKLADLRPLAGMRLTQLRIRNSGVTSLAPLHGMPLTELDVTAIPARDFEALTGLPLEVLFLQEVDVRDLSFLKGMPLKRLALWAVRGTTGYRVLPELKTLEILLLPTEALSLPEEECLAIDALEQLPNLRQVADWTEGVGLLTAVTSPKDTFFHKWKIYRAMHHRQFGFAEAQVRADVEEYRKKYGPGSFLVRAGLNLLVQCHIATGDFEKLAASSRELTDLDLEQQTPDVSDEENRDWTWYATALVLTGDTNGYQQACRNMFRRQADSGSISIRQRVMEVCLLAPNSGITAVEIQRLADSLIQAHLDRLPRIAFDLALKSYRAGEFERAAQQFKDIVVPDQDRMLAGFVDAALASTYFRLGKTPQAIERLNLARDYLRAIPNPGSKNRIGSPWTDWLWLNVFVKEAALIEVR